MSDSDSDCSSGYRAGSVCGPEGDASQQSQNQYDDNPLERLVLEQMHFFDVWEPGLLLLALVAWLLLLLSAFPLPRFGLEIGGMSLFEPCAYDAQSSTAVVAAARHYRAYLGWSALRTAVAAGAEAALAAVFLCRRGVMRNWALFLSGLGQGSSRGSSRGSMNVNHPAGENNGDGDCNENDSPYSLSSRGSLELGPGPGSDLEMETELTSSKSGRGAGAYRRVRAAVYQRGVENSSRAVDRQLEVRCPALYIDINEPAWVAENHPLGTPFAESSYSATHLHPRHFLRRACCLRRKYHLSDPQLRELSRQPRRKM